MSIKGKPIIVVSGLPRSGTSLMMQMLVAGGIEPLTDAKRKPDPDNPKGYYEFKLAKRLAANSDWLEKAPGKAVKIISALLPHLPPSYRYKVIFMERDMEEILASQRKMLARKGKRAKTSQDSHLAGAFKKHLQESKAWLSQQKNFAVLYINYNRLLNHPGVEIAKIGPFLGVSLNITAMLKVIDPRLYRQRAITKAKAAPAP